MRRVPGRRSAWLPRASRRAAWPSAESAPEWGRDRRFSTHPLDVDLARDLGVDRERGLSDPDDGGGALLLEAEPGPGPEAEVRELDEPRGLAGGDVHDLDLLP